MNTVKTDDEIFPISHTILVCAREMLIFSARLRQGFCNSL